MISDKQNFISERFQKIFACLMPMLSASEALKVILVLCEFAYCEFTKNGKRAEIANWKYPNSPFSCLDSKFGGRRETLIEEIKRCLQSAEFPGKNSAWEKRWKNNVSAVADANGLLSRLDLNAIEETIGGIRIITKQSGYDFTTIAASFLQCVNLILTDKNRFTPKEIAELIAALAINDPKKVHKICDFSCGSGEMLLAAAKRCEKAAIFGEELNTDALDLSYFSLLLNGVSPADMDIENTFAPQGSPFRSDNFDCIISNPPFSAKWDDSTADSFYRSFGALAPKSRADYAFIVQALRILGADGTAAIVQPHGVLFREGSEAVIRKNIIEKHYLRAVIGLPDNLFTGTAISVVILIMKNDALFDDTILFIDASKEPCEKERNYNVLSASTLQKIVNVYNDRQNSDGFSRKVPIEEIKKNNYVLNISRYITQTGSHSEEIRFDEIETEITKIDAEAAATKQRLKALLCQLLNEETT